MTLTGKIERGGGDALALRLLLDPESVRALGGSVCRLEARLPLRFGPDGLPTPDMHGPLRGVVRWKGAVGPLWSLAPVADQRLGGQLDLSLDLGGSPAAPAVKGFVQMDGGRYENVQLGAQLQDINLRVDLDSCTATVGDTQANLTRRELELLYTLAAHPGKVFSRENLLAHATASAWIVNARRDRVLMAYHNIYRSWAWIGGHADGQADLAAVALRELEEETGVHAAHLVPCGPGNVLSCEVLTVDGHVKRGAYVSSHLHLNVTYLAVADPAEHVRIKADENSGVKWAKLDEAVALSSEPWIRERIYRKLIEKTRELAPRFATR